MRIVLISLFMLLPFLNRDAPERPHAPKGNCEQSKQKALDDLKQGRIEFLLQGGIAPVHFPGQALFEKKYGLHYRDYGCIIPKGICMDIYNREVGKYLDQKHGKAWRKEVRKDVQGV